MNFLGYKRPDGRVGIRNHTLIIANGRNAANLGALISKSVQGAKCFVATNENGRGADDRAAIARTLTGLGNNPNVGAVLVVGAKRDGSHEEFFYDAFVGEIAGSGKPLETLFMDECGGFDAALGAGVRKARNLLIAASRAERVRAGLGDLFLAVKCGYSDASSGMAGNPAVGHLFDSVVDAGGTAVFSETTEVIGAEHLLSKRFTSPCEAAKFLAAVQRVEDEAKALGKDIRTINPIPANIAAGLSTLEEKSLGAIAKAGRRPLGQCLRYAESPKSRGLHFMDSWMSSSVLFLGFAAAGSVLNIFQVGGGSFGKGQMMPTANAGVVAPTIFMTGNPRTFENTGEDMDFSAAGILTERRPISHIGNVLCEKVCKIAGGELTKGETLNIEEVVEVYLRGACF
ncbi:MAG: UxaA family hydrolase [Desulfovibrio sp.]|jgi:altronate dehydratase large subunit|nr:UxaA family hydrolase [Desulfovibrio sp.]